jgi:glycosyltransferase involved in cell wall biosynthesis
VKQYLNLGIPAVSTIVGENPKFIKNGHNGFLYETIDELKTILTAFYHLPEQERIFLRSNATDSASEFQLENISKEWINALKDQQR